MPGNEVNTIVASFEADLKGAGVGRAVICFRFLRFANNSDGETFNIFAALGNGKVVNFSLITDISEVDGNKVTTNSHYSKIILIRSIHQL